MSVKSKVSVKGFRSWRDGWKRPMTNAMPRPAEQVATVERLIAEVREEAREFNQDALVTVRSCVYCGPGSAGDRGAVMVEVYRGSRYHGLTTVEKNGQVSR